MEFLLYGNLFYESSPRFSKEMLLSELLPISPLYEQLLNSHNSYIFILHSFLMNHSIDVLKVMLLSKLLFTFLNNNHIIIAH